MIYSEPSMCPVCGLVVHKQVIVHGNYDPGDTIRFSRSDDCQFCKGLKAGSKALHRQLVALSNANSKQIASLRQLLDSYRE